MATHAELRKTRRRARLIGGVAVAGAVAASAITMAGIPANAASVPLGTYSATLPLSPYPTVSSSADPSGIGFPVTFTNNSAGGVGYLLDHVEVTVPTGFAPTSGSASVSASGWTASISGNTISADAPSTTAGLPPGSSLVLRFSATAPTVPVPTTFTFATAGSGLLGATGVIGDFGNTGSDPTVSVARYANVVSCSPSQHCDTGVVGSASDTTARIVTSTGAIEDFLGITVDKPTDASCLAISQANARSEQVTFADIDTSRTLTATLTIDKSVVNLVPNNGVGGYGVCYNTGDPTKVFVDHLGHTTSVGWLPDCGTPGLIARQPCITSRNKTQAGDILITYTAPGGDPANIAGYPIPGT
jgi:hypothetical protein